LKIINGLGGSGSSYVLRSLEKHRYRNFLLFDTYRMGKRLKRKSSIFASVYHLCLRVIGFYSPKLKILMRPDSFWTDWNFHETGIFDPSSPTYKDDLLRQRDYIVATKHTRSAGLKISTSDLSVDSLTALVESYLKYLNAVEQKLGYKVILIASHWGEYGIFKELGVETIYLIRDPFNSLISHSKAVRHEKDYKRRGLANINTKEWIDNFLLGPHHYWLNHAWVALEHKSASIVRYSRFVEDWKKLQGVPDITPYFEYKENPVTKILTRKSIEYISEKTKTVCELLGIADKCIEYTNGIIQ
jgi:hypothetical protein